MFCLCCQASKDLLKAVALLIKRQREDRALDFLCLFFVYFQSVRREDSKNPKAVFLIVTQRNQDLIFLFFLS